MTPLRQRFIEDLQLRNRSPKTIEAYVYHVRELARYYNQSPEQLGDDQIHRFLLHLLHHKQVSWSSYNQAVAALRIFYGVTYPSDTVVTRLPYGKRPKRLPAVRSPQQVALFLDTVRDRTVQMVLRTICATGFRISEALHLTAPQIDSSRMVVRVLGKGQKERLVPLSPRLLEELRGSSVFKCKTSRIGPSGPWPSGGCARSSSRSLATPDSSPGSIGPTDSS